MLSGVWMDFIEKYFIEPIIKGTGYNVVNTFAYALLLVVGVWIGYKILRKLGVEINRDFFIGLFPFIMLGGVLRALEDGNFFQSYLFVTPGIYFIMFGFTLVALVISIVLEGWTEYSYYKTLFGIGLFPLIYFLSFIRIINFYGFVLLLFLAGFWFVLLYSLRNLKKKMFSRINLMALWAHLFDASATFISITFFSYLEQHVLPSFLIRNLGAWVMFPLKFFIVLPVLYLIDENIEEENLKYWLKIVVFILGFALGIRDSLALITLA